MVSQLNIKYIIIALVIHLISTCSNKLLASEIDSLINHETALLISDSKVDANIKIARSYIEFDFIKAIEYAKKSLQLSKDINYEEGTINSLSCEV